MKKSKYKILKGLISIILCIIIVMTGVVDYTSAANASEKTSSTYSAFSKNHLTDVRKSNEKDITSKSDEKQENSGIITVTAKENINTAAIEQNVQATEKASFGSQKEIIETDSDSQVETMQKVNSDSQEGATQKVNSGSQEGTTQKVNSGSQEGAMQKADSDNQKEAVQGTDFGKQAQGTAVDTLSGVVESGEEQNTDNISEPIKSNEIQSTNNILESIKSNEVQSTDNALEIKNQSAQSEISSNETAMEAQELEVNEKSKVTLITEGKANQDFSSIAEALKKVDEYIKDIDISTENSADNIDMKYTIRFIEDKYTLTADDVKAIETARTNTTIIYDGLYKEDNENSYYTNLDLNILGDDGIFFANNTAIQNIKLIYNKNNIDSTVSDDTTAVDDNKENKANTKYLVIAANGYKLTIGQNVETPADTKIYSGFVGTKNKNSVQLGKESELIINSGTYESVVAGGSKKQDSSKIIVQGGTINNIYGSKNAALKVSKILVRGGVH